ncbi:hypothetical protein FB567DRAFT_619782 [Paraphoma chrysanthemicola]|uniref:Uncharacterized protein n=1 Tax=Paraphoma chrysanthemicola TaxID=798071 RepID=A0A8K0RAR3_9PLEO|nr:hypothetical protein FB567DRAFT_619782 [Paraphoma chrysanthemicola]
MEPLDALPSKTEEANVVFATNSSNNEMLPAPPPSTTPQERRDKLSPAQLDLNGMDARATQVARRESAPEVLEAERSSAVFVDDASRMDLQKKRPAPTNEPGMREEKTDATNVHFQADLERIRDSTTAAERNAAALTLENEALTAEIETLRAEKEDLESENEDLESENDKLSLEVNEVISELEHRSAEVDRLVDETYELWSDTQHLDEVKLENERLEDEIESAQLYADMLVGENDDLRSEVSRLRQLNAELADDNLEFKQVRLENERLEDDVETAVVSAALLVEENDGLRREANVQNERMGRLELKARRSGKKLKLHRMRVKAVLGPLRSEVEG